MGVFRLYFLVIRVWSLLFEWSHVILPGLVWHMAHSRVAYHFLVSFAKVVKPSNNKNSGILHRAKVIPAFWVEAIMRSFPGEFYSYV